MSDCRKLDEKPVLLAPIGSGLGDVIVCLPVIRYLIRSQSQPVYLVARSLRQLGFDELIPGLAGTVREPDLAELLISGGRLINLRDHDLQKKFDWLSPEFRKQFPNTNIESILGIISSDFSIFPDFESREKLSYTVDRRGEGKILLVPATTSVSKHLLAETWFDLVCKLNRAGVHFAVLGEPDRSPIVRDLISRGVEHVATPKLTDAVNVISSCDLVVAVDTGLMHIAVEQGIATVLIAVRDSVYYRPRPNCFPLFANEIQDVPLKPAKEFSVSYEKFVWCDGLENPDSQPIASVTAEQIFLEITRLFSRQHKPLDTGGHRLH